MADDLTFMVFINLPNADGEPSAHYGQFPVVASVASSLELMMERLCSWAIDDQRFQRCIVTPEKDENGDTYFELDITNQRGGRLTLLACVFKATVS